MTTQTPIIPPVSPNEPQSGWWNWLQSLAQAINQTIAWVETAQPLLDHPVAGPVAFADLPTPTVGMLACVTDSTTAVWGAVIAGGGANTVLAWYNGSWKVIGS